jgi:hypothetical protein
MVSLILIVLFLTGCETTYVSNYNVSNTVIITDVRITKMPSYTGKGGYFAVIYSKNGKQSDEYRVPSNICEEIRKIKNTDKMTDSNEQLYDITTDGEEIFTISLSKNRRN